VAKRWRRCCVRVTPGRTRRPITSRCWIRPVRVARPRPAVSGAWIRAAGGPLGLRRRHPRLRPGVPGPGGVVLLQFSVDARIQAIADRVPGHCWAPAIQTHGGVRDGAWVAEVTGMLDLATWPEGSRVSLRAERPHPGAHLTFTDADGHRITAFITDIPDRVIAGQTAGLELNYRQHARAEDRILPGSQGHRPAQPAVSRIRREHRLAAHPAHRHRPGVLGQTPRLHRHTRTGPRRDRSRHHSRSAASSRPPPPLPTAKSTNPKQDQLNIARKTEVRDSARRLPGGQVSVEKRQLERGLRKRRSG
jgi:hypothetical protein